MFHMWPTTAISGLFWRIHQMDFSFYFVHFIIGTAVSTYFLNLAYQNMKFILKHKFVALSGVGKWHISFVRLQDCAKTRRSRQSRNIETLQQRQEREQERQRRSVSLRKRKIARGTISSLHRVLTRKNEVADFEATTFSIFYNNAFYLVCLIILSFFVFKNFSPTVNYLFSVTLSTAVVFLFSTGQK